MQSGINKIIWGIVLILVCLFSCYIIYDIAYQEKEAYETKFYYMDHFIYVKVYEQDSKKAKEALDKIEKIYKKYGQYANRKSGYPGVKNSYYILNNKETSEYITLDSEFLDVLKLALEYQDEYDKFEIDLGDVLDQAYFSFENGIVPTLSKSDKKIILNETGILNNGVSIDLSNFILSYTTKKTIEYLDSVGISSYVIDAGGVVSVGEHYANDKYKVGLINPENNQKSTFLTVTANEMSIVTKGTYEDSYFVDNVRYSTIMDPTNYSFVSDYLSVTTIYPDPILAEVYATILFHMDLEEALEFVNRTDDLEAIFYLSSEEQVTSNNFDLYLP
jgi:thiamine biosynthesis lipoprotein